MAHLSPERLALLRGMLARQGLAVPRAGPIPRRAERGAAPLSFAQERLFFLELYQPGTPLYNDALAVRVSGPLDPELVRRALAQIARRHEVLRTSFELGPAGPVQRIHEALELPLRLLDLRAEPASREKAALIARAEARVPFALEQAPLWRATLAQTGDREWLLVLAMHHLISDGASCGILFRELSELYEASGAERGSQLPALAVQFGDYAAWERAAIGEQRIAELLPGLTRSLSGPLPSIGWPGSSGTPSQRGAFHFLRLPDELHRGLQACARRERVTTNHVLLAALFACLHGISGESDLRVGVASSLRRRPELEPLIGFFAQTLVLRVDLGGDPTLREALQRVRDAALEAARCDEVPFDRVVRALGRRDGPPLVQACFSHMRDAIAPPRFGDARTSFEFVDPGAARFELSLVLHESAAETTGFLEHDLALLEPAAVEELAAAYLHILERLVARPGSRLAELSPGRARRARFGRPPIPFPRKTRRAAGE